MADQATGTVDVSSAHGVQHLPHNPGRPVSWVGVGIAILGSIVAGWSWAPPFAPPILWPMFYVGAGVMVVGLLILAGAKTFSTDWY